MGYYVSNIISINVWHDISSGVISLGDIKVKVRKVIANMPETDIVPDTLNDLDCMSGELSAWKGSYVVIAGVFNYWMTDDAALFAKLLSVEFDTDVIFTSYDHERETLVSQVYDSGVALFKEISLNQIEEVD